MKRLVLAGLILITGCKGPKGDKGDPGPGTISNLIGNATSDNFVVSNPRLQATSSITVFVGSWVTNQFTECPVYNPNKNFNVGYILSNGSITLMNLVSGGVQSYSIVIVSASAPSYMGSRLLE